eukprot:CAMPEP_0184376966 /NCGR_PEP_ID=MMETSP0007-20130409/1878_1 /TAXON_ID=97485 /ORGANISM="Prymnesium parvum, Strain Texoma1" /LENGTH=87 /DNA_ID=CAMNT_0026720691 /DNA_START=301 /DNA_END=564 /DNA_ORIENTATION=-
MELLPHGATYISHMQPASAEKLIEQWQYLQTVRPQLASLHASLAEGGAKLELLAEIGCLVSHEELARCYATHKQAVACSCLCMVVGA